MAIIVRADGHVEPLKTRHVILTLKELQAAVGGYIEIVPHKGGVLVCNEEGRLRKLPVNVRFPQYVGDVVLCKRTEIE